MSAPTSSHKSANSFIKEILVTRNAFEAYLIISAVRKSVMTIGARNGKCKCATFSAASRCSEPITVRCGFIKSEIAEPSRKNSGQDTTENGTGWGWALVTISATQSPVPMGTVDLLMMISGAVIFFAIDFAAASTYCKSASPLSALGVPTAMNAYSASFIASAYEVVNESRPDWGLCLTS